MMSSVTTDDVARIGALLTRFESSAGGGHLAMAEAAGAIARAGGSGGPDVVLRAMQGGQGTDQILRAPWQWLRAVAGEATRHQNWALVARIAWFAQFWSEHVLPTMDRGEALETGLAQAPDDLRADLAALALTTMSNVDRDAVLTRDATGAGLPVGHVAKACALELTRAAEVGVPVTTAALALAQRELGATAASTPTGAVAGPSSEGYAARLAPVGTGQMSADPDPPVGASAPGKGTFGDLGVLFAKDSSTADRVRALRDFGGAAGGRLSSAASAAEQGKEVLVERSAQLLSEVAGRLPIRTADTLRRQHGDDPEAQAQNVIAEAGRLAGLLWTAAAAVPGPPPVVQAIKVVVHSAIEIRMIGELYAIHADGADRDATWLGTVLLAWSTGQPVAPGGSAASTASVLVNKIRSSTSELIGSQNRAATVASRGRDGTETVLRAGGRMHRRMRLHPSSWPQPGSQSSGTVVLDALGKVAADQLGGRVPQALVTAARDRMSPSTPPVPGEPIAAAAADPGEVLVLAWTLHRRATVAASQISPSDPAAPRLTAALTVQQRHLEQLGRRLGKPVASAPAQKDGSGGGDVGWVVWQAEAAIDVVEDAGARSRRLPSWSTRKRAALVYFITALAVSVLPAVALLNSSGFGMFGLLLAQCMALPWLSLAVAAIAVGRLFRPWLGGPVPRHPVIGTWIVLAVHVGLGVLVAVVGLLT